MMDEVSIKILGKSLRSKEMIYLRRGISNARMSTKGFGVLTVLVMVMLLFFYGKDTRDVLLNIRIFLRTTRRFVLTSSRDLFAGILSFPFPFNLDFSISCSLIGFV